MFLSHAKLADMACMNAISVGIYVFVRDVFFLTNGRFLRSGRP